MRSLRGMEVNAQRSTGYSRKAHDAALAVDVTCDPSIYLGSHDSLLLRVLDLSYLAAMEALRLQRKYPDVSRDEMFDLINRFK
jgi:hypothetical protein